MIVEVIQTTRLYDNRIFVPKEIRDRFELDNGMKLLWGINKDGEIVIARAENLDGLFSSNY